MKFSIVIPTRNRLEYLKIAVASILCQDYDNWEIVISDNDSTEDIQGYVLTLNDPRIRYSRTEKFVSVTENWNRALNQSTGEYVIFIGDDDSLMRGSLTLLQQLITQYSLPDLVFSNALIYFYPRDSSASSNGHLTTIGNWHLWGSDAPSILNREKVHEIVKESLNFRLRFSYNLQALTMHRSLIEKLKFNGQFFHSPYPDYYAMTVLLQEAEKILACPYPVTVVGVCPKSFGGNMCSGQEHVGMAALNIGAEISQYPELKRMILPGREFYTCWLYALRSAQKHLPDATLKINFSRFRRLQMLEFLGSLPGTSGRAIKLLQFCRLLRTWENVVYGPILWLTLLVDSFCEEKTSRELIDRMKVKLDVHHGHVNYHFNKSYTSIPEIISEITPHGCHKHLKNYRGKLTEVKDT